MYARFAGIGISHEPQFSNMKPVDAVGTFTEIEGDGVSSKEDYDSGSSDFDDAAKTGSGAEVEVEDLSQSDKDTDENCYARFTSPLYYLPYPGIELPTSLR